MLVVVIWGANFSFLKLGLVDIPPFAFAAIRFVLGTVILVWIVRVREGAIGWTRANAWPMLWLGVVGNTIYQALFMAGLDRTTVANGALLIATSPIMVTVLGGLFRVERLTRPVVLGVLIGFLGTVLVLGGRGVAVGRATLLGDAMVLGSALCWAVYILGVRTLRTPMSSLRLTALTMITGTPGLVVLAVPELSTLDWGAIGLAAWGGMAYSTMLALVVAYILWNEGVQVLGGARTAVFGCGVPAVAMLVAWPLLGERPGLMQVTGAAMIVAGVLVSRFRSREPDPVPPCES